MLTSLIFTKIWSLKSILLLVDKSGERFFHINAPWFGALVGYIIGISTFSVGGRYFAMFLMATSYSGIILSSQIISGTHHLLILIVGFALTLVWVSNAIPRPPTKRAVAIGIVNGIGNIGNM